MKNQLITLAFLLLTTVLIAQTADQVTTSGEVTYTTKVNIHKMLKGDRSERMKKMLPEFKTIKQVLYFSETETFFKKMKVKEDVVEGDLEGGRGSRFMRMMGGSDNDIYYTNLDDETITEQKDFLGKTFLISDEIEPMNWKLSGEQKTINGYVCQKATLVIPKKKEEAPKKENKAKKDKKGKKAKKEAEGRGKRRNRGPKNVVAWFTSQIPVSAGPSKFAQLPGLVVQVEIDGGNTTIIAENISLKNLEKGTIKAPKKGKKVTRAEFKKIQKEKFEEMRKSRGGHGKGGRMFRH